MIQLRARARATAALFVLALLAPAARAEGEKLGRLEQREGVQILVLEGTPRERGRAQGRAFAKQISDSAAELAVVMKGQFHDPARHAAIVKSFDWPADVSEELDGILEGVREKLGAADVKGLGRPLERFDLEALNTVPDCLPFACSSFTISGNRVEGGGTLTARNLDYPAFKSMLATKLVVVRMPRDGARGWATVSWPGAVGCFTGMNDAGVTASIHDVRTGKEALARQRFIPRALGPRAILESTGPGDGWVERAADVLRKTPVIYGNNIHVSAARSAPCAAILEWGPAETPAAGVTVRLADEGAPTLCTNHWRLRQEPIDCPRYAALTKALGDAIASKQTPESALELLRVANVDGFKITAHSVVFALEQRTMLVAFARSNERGAAFEPPLKLDLGAILDGATARAEPEKAARKKFM